MTVISRTLVAASLFTASIAAAGPQVELAPVHGVAPAGGGLETVEATLKGMVLEVRSGGGPTKSIMVPLGKPDLAGARITAVAIGEGKHVLHVRVPEGPNVYEAILAGNGKDPVFSGLTGYTTGEEGERAGQVVVVTDRDDASKFVLVGEVREDTRLCGQAMTPLSVRALDPRSMQLRGASVHRIEKKERDGATKIVAVSLASSAAPKPPLARLLVASGGSAAGSPALTDGKLETAWSEARSGDGHGEFVTMHAPTETPLHSLVLNVTPTTPITPRADGAAPRTFFVATDQKLFHVTMPEDAWGKPGSSYEVTFPEPVRTSCVAVVLDEAYDRDLASPVVSIAEVSARTKFDADGASLEDVVKELSGPRADEAAAILRRGGDPALAAVSARYASLDPKARAFAIDVAASVGSCTSAPAMELLTRALADAEREVRKRASGRIERCGKNAIDALSTAIRSNEEPRRAASATLLASIAPAAAWDPLTEQIGKGTPETRHAVRAALTKSALALAATSNGSNAGAGLAPSASGASDARSKMIALLTKSELGAEARLDAMRALAPAIGPGSPEAMAALASMLDGRPDMRTRYLLAEPLAQLGDVARLEAMMKSDPDPPVRARAIEVSRTNPRLIPTIANALADPEPRVREASLRAFVAPLDAPPLEERPPIRGSLPLDAFSALAAWRPRVAGVLAHDEWSFVRVAAAEALGALGSLAGDASGGAALAKALRDPSVKVRATAVKALGNARAVNEAAKIRERLDDAKEDVEVRALSARTLGQLCVQSATDRLTRLAVLAGTPVDETDERLGMAALDALGMLHPADIAKRLAPLRAKGSRTLLKRAADRAVSEPGTCSAAR